MLIVRIFWRFFNCCCVWERERVSPLHWFYKFTKQKHSRSHLKWDEIHCACVCKKLNTNINLWLTHSLFQSKIQINDWQCIDSTTFYMYFRTQCILKWWYSWQQKNESSWDDKVPMYLQIAVFDFEYKPWIIRHQPLASVLYVYSTQMNAICFAIDDILLFSAATFSHFELKLDFFEFSNDQFCHQ